MKFRWGCFSILLSVPAFSATLASRLGVPFGITVNSDCNNDPNPQAIAATVASYDAILFQWSDMHSLQAAIVSRAQQDRAAGLKVVLGLSPTALSGARTDIDLPPWVASACGLTQATASFLNPCLKAQFIADATTYVAVIQPDDFHLATEINTLILRKVANPADNEYVYFALLYQQAYPAVKAVSPASKVFVSFQYELQTTLESGTPGSWDILLDVYRSTTTSTSFLDYVAYTTYPSSSALLSGLYATPADIPATYYAAANLHLKFSEQAAFTEVGWPTQASGSETTQQAYLDRLPTLMSPAHPAFVTWALLYDVAGSPLASNLATVGVRNCDGTAKPGWSILTGTSSGGEVPSTISSLGSVHIYPNPFRPSQNETAMHFTMLPASTRLRLYTLAGELVKDFSADSSGSATWDGINQSGQKVASGVYLLYLQGSGTSKTLKVAVQR